MMKSVVYFAFVLLLLASCKREREPQPVPEELTKLERLYRTPPSKRYVNEFKDIDTLSHKASISLRDNCDSASDSSYETFFKEIDMVPYNGCLDRNDAGLIERENLSGDTVYEVTDVEAQFPGGDEALRRYLSVETEKYASCFNHEHGVVRIKVIIEKDGTVSHPYVISDRNSVNLFSSNKKAGFLDFQKAAVNIVKQMPKWTPAMKDGKKVRSFRSIWVIFRLK